MAKSSRRVTFELPPASYAILEQAAQENGINAPAAASLILQAALVRRVSGLVPKRPRPATSGSGGKATTEMPAAGDSAATGRPAAVDTVSSPESPQGPGTA
jgi:hypothetical protein